MQVRPLSIAEVLALLRAGGDPGRGVLREYLAHLVAQGSADPELHTQLALQLAAWAASLLPPADPGCAFSSLQRRCIVRSGQRVWSIHDGILLACSCQAPSTTRAAGLPSSSL